MLRFLLFLGSSSFVAGLAWARVGVRVGANLLDGRTQIAADDTRATASHRASYQVDEYYQQLLAKRLLLVPQRQFSHEQAQAAFKRYSSV